MEQCETPSGIELFDPKSVFGEAAEQSTADKRCYYITNLGGGYLSEPRQAVFLKGEWECTLTNNKRRV